MGYINHHAIVATSWDEKYLAEAHKKALEIFGETCTEIVISPVNRYATFFVAPDGSKEGWESSNEGNERRDEFDNWLKANDNYVEAVEIYYGGDEPNVKGIRILGEITEEEIQHQGSGYDQS